MDLYYNLNQIQNNEDTNKFFLLLACEIGSIELIEWLIHFDYTIDIKLEDNLPFQIACENNNLEVAKYLYKINPNMSFQDKNFLFNILNYEYYELVKWIYEVIPDVFNFLTNEELYNIFDKLIHRNFNMAKWLIEKFPCIPLFLNKNELFIRFCKNNEIEKAKLFTSIKPNIYFINIIDEKIIHYEVLKILDIKKKTKKKYKVECYICYENISNVKTSCNHFYCMNCIELHYSINDVKCPYCRKENFENELYMIEI